MSECYYCKQSLPDSGTIEQMNWRFINLNAGGAGGSPSIMVPACFECRPTTAVTISVSAIEEVMAKWESEHPGRPITEMTDFTDRMMRKILP